MRVGKKPRLTKRAERWYREILSGWAGLNRSMQCWPGEEWAWAAYGFAKRWSGRDIDLARLANIVLRSDNPEVCYRYARDVPGANVRKFQRQVLRYGTATLMRTFAREISGADKHALESMAIVAEIMLD